MTSSITIAEYYDSAEVLEESVPVSLPGFGPRKSTTRVSKLP
jgi:hypothetical protein